MKDRAEAIVSAPLAPLMDAHQRPITYLRVSVTDRCNLRCVYCMPEAGVEFRPHEEILHYEEIADIVRVAASMGLTQVRLTGGEPLARRNLVDLVRQVSAVPAVEDLSLTTNGTLLARNAQELAGAGLRRVNVSLDTLQPERFAAITRHGRYEDVLEGIAAARAAGLSPIKLNVVLMPNVNDDEVLDFARSTLEEKWDVRFIELMPFMEEQEVCIRDTSLLTGSMPVGEVRRQIEAEFGPMKPSRTIVGHGPARYYRIPGARGNLGFIGPLSEPDFCASCNRMRLTADGKLRPCLLTDHEVDLKSIIRSGGGEEGIRRGILQALATKPDAHHLGDGNRPQSRRMAQIGG